MRHQEQNPILVIGGTGKTGRRIVARLRAKNLPVRVGSRNEATPFKWEDPSTWPAVLQGVQTAYVAYYPDLASEGAHAAIKAFAEMGRDMGLKRVVLLSGRGEPETEPCEAEIQDFDWTVLRCSWFNQNFSESFFAGPLAAGALQLPVPDTPEPFIDADDIADAAVAVLTENGHSGRLYELTGPRALTFTQVVAEIAAATGRDMAFERISTDAYRAMMREAGVPEPVIELTLYLYQVVLDGRNSQPSDDIQRILGRPAKDFSAFAREAAATGCWAAPVAVGGTP